MPTVLRVGRFRFHFYSNESGEPPHIHVRTPEGECKYWLGEVALARNRGVKPVDLSAIERLVFQHQALLVAKYHEHHGL